VPSRIPSPSTSSVTSSKSVDSDVDGNDLTFVTEKFSGFLAEFLAEYASPSSPKSPLNSVEHNNGDTAHLPSDARSHASEISESPAPSSWRSEDLTTDDSLDEDDGHEGASTIADGESNWEDEDLDTPGSPGSDIELYDGIIRRGMYITVVLSNRERNTALPCTAKVLDVHDRKGKFTLRLSKSARRATRTMWNVNPRSPNVRGRFASPRQHV
jgi:hypothetical protein